VAAQAAAAVAVVATAAAAAAAVVAAVADATVMTSGDPALSTPSSAETGSIDSLSTLT